jgi:hypothetical protein
MKTKKEKNFDEMNTVEKLDYFASLERAENCIVLANDKDGKMTNVTMFGSAVDLSSMLIGALHILYENGLPERVIDEIPRLAKSNNNQLEEIEKELTETETAKEALMKMIDQLIEKMKEEEK